jgi:Tfp pilus assembly protein PilX
MTSASTATPRKSRAGKRRERGAALILTVVVIMILTTLALTMATFTVTEERTATTYRDSLQTRAVAEAGARVVQEMFRSPTDRQLVPLYSATATADGAGWDYWGATDAAIETELNQKGIWRAERSGTNPAKYSGNDNRFFQGPFKDNWARLFSGTYSNDTAVAPDLYDLKFNCTNPNDATVVIPSTECWLDSKINALLNNGAVVNNKLDVNVNTGKITDISFYAPPTVGGRAYGLATIRITAVKYDTDLSTANVIARETIEAVMIDTTPKPAVLGNGNIVFVMQGGSMCGNGCEQIHANGNAQVGTITGGSDPMVTATGTISGGAASNKPNAKAVTTPHINPWDLAYKPTLTSELNMYYLAAARPLDIIWTNGDASDNTPARPCGPGLWSSCQDYGLEYTPAGAPKLRTAADTPYLYKWDSAGQGWTECDSGTSLDGGTACIGAPTFTVSRAADQPAAGTGDLNVIPYNVNAVPQTQFTITGKQDGATVLVDGKFYKSGSMDATMSIIAAGTIGFHASSTWYPAMSNRVMWISGRDLDTHSNCCASSNTCSTNLVGAGNPSIIAAHEQIVNDSQTALLGIIVGENRVNFDMTVNSTLALDLQKGDHGSLCNDPEYPWTLPVTPAIASMKTAMN